MPILKGTHVLVRGTNSGVFAGTLGEREDNTVELIDCRRLWKWVGASSISQIALDGVKSPKDCMFTVTVPQIEILDAIEIIPTTEEARKSINGVAIWKSQAYF